MRAFRREWMYLSGLYNLIKSVQARTGNGSSPAGSRDAINDMKAGFIEDAETLHLATKSLFVSVIKAWASETKVKQAYIDSVPGGLARFEDLKKRVDDVWEREANRWSKKFKSRRVSSNEAQKSLSKGTAA